MFVIDTNVASELMRPAPNPTVAAWIAEQDAEAMYLTAVSEAELLLRRRDHAGRQATQRTGSRHARVARSWVHATDSAVRQPPLPEPMRRSHPAVAELARPIGEADCQIAAISRSRGAVLVTRNVRDFESTDVELVDPWTVAMSGTTEAFARVKIDALLQDAGWNLSDGSSVLFEHALPDGTQADYVLCDRQGRPIAVIEAKRASIDPIAAQDQGRHYARQLEVPFVFLSNGEEVRFLDGEADAHARKIAGFYAQDDLERRIAARRVRRELSAVAVDRKIVDRDYQIDCVETLSAEVARGRAQTAGRNGDGYRQDPHGGGLHQAAVRGGHRYPRPVPRRSDRVGPPSRGRVYRPSPGPTPATCCVPAAVSTAPSASRSRRCKP